MTRTRWTQLALMLLTIVFAAALAVAARGASVITPQIAHESTAHSPTVTATQSTWTNIGWTPAHGMCVMDGADFTVTQGRRWKCTKSADKNGWDLLIEATPAR